MRFKATKLNLSATILHRCAAFIMMLSVAATTFNKVIVLLDFRLNKNYIAASLCVNRDKPRSCCHGKCFLKKQLQKEDDQGKNGPPVSKDKIDIPLFCETITAKNINPQSSDKIFSDYYLLKKYTNISSPVFHPPGKA